MYFPAKRKVELQWQLEWMRIAGSCEEPALDRKLEDILTPDGRRAYVGLSTFATAHGQSELPLSGELRLLARYPMRSAACMSGCKAHPIHAPLEAAAFVTGCHRLLERTCLMLATSLTVTSLLAATGRVEELLTVLAQVNHCGATSRHDARARGYRRWTRDSTLFTSAWISNALAAALFLRQPLSRAERIRLATIFNHAAWIAPPTTCLALASAACSCPNTGLIRRAAAVASPMYRQVLTGYLDDRRLAIQRERSTRRLARDASR